MKEVSQNYTGCSLLSLLCPKETLLLKGSVLVMSFVDLEEEKIQVKVKLLFL